MFTNIFNIAKANIKGGKKYPKINGVVTFREVKNGVLVTAKVNGLPQSSDSCTGRFFGFHIHEGSSCSGTISDEIENNGYAHMTVLINKFKIKDILGKVVIIHDSPDDFTTQPSGNSGSKIACGIIE